MTPAQCPLLVAPLGRHSPPATPLHFELWWMAPLTGFAGFISKQTIKKSVVFEKTHLDVCQKSGLKHLFFSRRIFSKYFSKISFLSVFVGETGSDQTSSFFAFVFQFLSGISFVAEKIFFYLRLFRKCNFFYKERKKKKFEFEVVI